MKVKFTILLIVSFGFALHWLITNLPIKTKAGSIFMQNVTGKYADPDNFITYVNYDGNEFNPKTVTIKKGNYLAITNKSKDKLMWLVSDNADLNTKRDYGESERLQLTLLKEGTYKVANKLDMKSSLEVVVEP